MTPIQKKMMRREHNKMVNKELRKECKTAVREWKNKAEHKKPDWQKIKELKGEIGEWGSIEGLLNGRKIKNF